MAGGINPFGFAVSAPQPAPRAPIDLPSAPFGFAPPPSKWEQTAAILNEYNPIDAFWRLYNSDMAKGGAITDQNIEDGMMVGGTVMGGGAMIPKPANALNMGIRAYHGSPHSFDKFSMEKLGTGEGAQAYGDGLYFTENENIAKGYRDALTDPEQVKIRINDKHIPSVWVDDLRNTFPEMYKGLRPDDQDIMDSLLGTMESAYSIEDAARAAESVGGRAKTLFNQRVKPFVTKPEVGPGSMYEVDINADPEKFLDWHKPLNEQTQYIKDALGGGIDLNNWGHKTGEDLVKYGLANGHRQFLMEREVPGIKYLANDGSRSAGEGARNYVVFDDKLISIVKKYGIAGASAMLGYNLLESVNPAQADELKRIEAGK